MTRCVLLKSVVLVMIGATVATQSALWLLLGGAVLHSGLQSFLGIFSSAPSPATTTADPVFLAERSTAAQDSSLWTVSVTTALQWSGFCLLGGIFSGVYLVYRLHSAGVWGAPQHCQQNNTVQIADVNRLPAIKDASDRSRSGSRRGRRGVLELGQARTKSPGVVSG